MFRYKLKMTLRGTTVLCNTWYANVSISIKRIKKIPKRLKRRMKTHGVSEKGKIKVVHLKGSRIS